LIQRLLQNSSILPTSTIVSSNNNNNDDDNHTIENVAKEITTNTKNSATSTTAINNMNISISNQRVHEIASPVVRPTTTTPPAPLDTNELCLDDLLKESYEKLMKANDTDTHQIFIMPHIAADNGFVNTNTISNNNNNNNSINNDSNVMTFSNDTSFVVGNMAINSNNGYCSNNFSTLETINEDSIKELLYGHVV
jgi:hypothetical protein